MHTPLMHGMFRRANPISSIPASVEHHNKKTSIIQN